MFFQPSDNAVIGHGSWKHTAAKIFQIEEHNKFVKERKSHHKKKDKERNSKCFSEQVPEISNPAVTFLSNSKAEIPSLKTEDMKSREDTSKRQNSDTSNIQLLPINNQIN